MSIFLFSASTRRLNKKRGYYAELQGMTYLSIVIEGIDDTRKRLYKKLYITDRNRQLESLDNKSTRTNLKEIQKTIYRSEKKSILLSCPQLL